MSQYKRAKYTAEYRKRKREMKEQEEAVPAMTTSERMKKYRLRKKLETTVVCNDPYSSTDTATSVAPGPIPGTSTDPVMLVSVSIEGISQDVTLSFNGKQI